MYPMHVRSDHEQSQYPINLFRDVDIAMVEHRHGIQQDLEDDDRKNGRPQQNDGGKLDQHRENNFQGMKSRTGGKVIVQVGVMHPVKAPQ